MPNKEAFAQWIADLRSGEFKQGHSVLRNGDDGYCCLGVACESYRRATGKGEWQQRPGNKFWEFNAYGYANGSVLPKPVTEWLGVDNSNPRFNGLSAAAMNDGKQWGFPRIADEIEDWLKTQ